MTAKHPIKLNPKSMTYLKEKGYEVDVCESRKGPVTVDLFNLFDIMAINDEYTVGVQVTTGSNHAARRTKILESYVARIWMKSATRDILILSWSQPVTDGKKQRTWVPREEWISEVMP